MFSKRSIFILAALLVTAVASSMAFAETTDDSCAAQEAASPDYKSRVIARDSNAAWQALESGNPDSVQYKDRFVGCSSDATSAWGSSETGNPHYARPGKSETASIQ